MITTQDLTLLYQIEVHCELCIRACVYARALSGSKRPMWVFTHNCFAEAAILHWCKVFGSRKEPTHYSHFFQGKCFSMPDCSKLTCDDVGKRLCAAAKMTP